MDGDWLFAPGTIPETSGELLDTQNRAATTAGNWDGHFKGDAVGLSDLDDPRTGAVSTMVEHNAMRFTQRLGLVQSLSCALSDLCVVSGDGQSAAEGTNVRDPVIIQVDSQQLSVDGNPISAPLSGVTIRVLVTAGDAKINGTSSTYSMTGPDGRAAFSNITVGALDSQLTFEIILPRSEYLNSCSADAVPPVTVSVLVKR